MVTFKTLFVGSRNGSRSMMAKALLNQLGKGRFSAESAGFEPGEQHPLAVQVMKEIGLDIAGDQPKSVFSLYSGGQKFHHIIQLCDCENGERCPVFPGHSQYIDWGMPDPENERDNAQCLEAMRRTRDALRARIQEWVNREHDIRRAVISVAVK